VYPGDNPLAWRLNYKEISIWLLCYLNPFMVVLAGSVGLASFAFLRVWRLHFAVSALLCTDLYWVCWR
jgi:hypothetical protein